MPISRAVTSLAALSPPRTAPPVTCVVHATAPQAIVMRKPAASPRAPAPAPPAPKTRTLCVFSDIDDTFVPSSDPGYPRGLTGYPGTIALYGALVGDVAHLPERLIFLTARPGDGFSWNPLSYRIQLATRELMAKLDLRSHVIFGDLWHCVPRPWYEPLSRMGDKKAASFLGWAQSHACLPKTVRSPRRSFLSHSRGCSPCGP
jgi:hypothetical protein